MNWKAWAPLVVAIVLALVAATVAHRMIARQNVVEPSDDTQFTKVAMVTHDIAPGTAMKMADVELREIGLDAPPAGTYTATSDLVDRVTLVPLSKGQPVLQSLLAPRGTGAGLQALVPKGKRAITVEVNETSGLAGMLLPGSHVDVLATVAGGDEGSTARTVVQDVKVIAVGQRLTAQEEKPKDGQPVEMARSVTLEATPEQSEAIELSAMTTRPRLVLRADGDDKPSKTSGITLVELRGKHAMPASNSTDVQPVSTKTSTPAPFGPFDIFGAKKPAAEARPAADPFGAHTREVKIIRGGQESTVTFEVPAQTGWMTGVSMDPITK